MLPFPRSLMIFRTDLNFLLISSKVVELLLPDVRRSGVVAIVEDIRTATLEELDFTLEASKLSAFRDFLKTEGLTSTCTAPRPYPEVSSKRCLVMEFVEGDRMIDREVGGEELIITALNTWTRSVISESSFHADLHSGNLLVTPDNRVAFIDFGITGERPRPVAITLPSAPTTLHATAARSHAARAVSLRNIAGSISDKVKGAVLSMTGALSKGDYVGVARALTEMGATEGEVDVESFGQDIKSSLQNLSTVSTTIKPGPDGVQVDVDSNEISSALVDVVSVAEKYGLKLPRSFGLIVKQCLYFDKYLNILAPNLDVATDARVDSQWQNGGGAVERPGEVEAAREVDVIV